MRSRDSGTEDRTVRFLQAHAEAQFWIMALSMPPFGAVPNNIAACYFTASC
jgi:hypothetical protein